MKIIVVLGFVLLLLFTGGAKAQTISTKSTKVQRIEIDFKEYKKNYKVFFFSEGKWFEAQRTLTGFIIPSQLKSEEYLTVLFTFGKYKIGFLKIHHSKFEEEWVVGVDNKPFSEEFVAPEEAKSIKRIHYIQFLGTGLVTQLIVTDKKSK